jgi:LPS-assembly protein
VPAFSIRETHYSSRLEQGQVVGSNLMRHAREVTLELTTPALARTFDGPGWLGDKVKHVIEPRAVFRHAAGVEDFDRIIRFDTTELMTNTTEVEFSLANRIYVKRGGEVSEMLSWQLWQSRYFDPDFGGAVTALDPITGKPRRNVVASSVNLTAFSFLDGPRRYSPVVSALRVAPLSGFGVEWRTDYDPLWRRPVNSWISGEWRHSILSGMLGHNLVRSGSQASAKANEFNGRFTVGRDNRRGWNAAFDTVHDFRTGVTRWITAQVTYNSDCCGFSFQYRLIDLVDRKDNLFRIAFSVANIGSFGSLRQQDRLF